MTTQTFTEGERVSTFDINGMVLYGTIHKNIDFPQVSQWYIRFDDGIECAVVDESLVIKQ